MTDQVPVLFGEVLFDCFDDGSRVLGGAPFNVAWHLQAFGCNPLLISRVGDDPMGQSIRDTMRASGMSTAGLQRDSSYATGEVSITLHGGQPSFDILKDRAYDYIQAEEMPAVAPSLVYHGSLGVRLPDSAAALQHLLHRHPAPVFMDVNLRSPWWQREQLVQLLDQAHWVKINDHELETLVGSPVDLQAGARKLMQLHDLSRVIVTCGAQGAFVIDGNDGFSEIKPAAETMVVDTVGAGDAFASVCILGTLHNWPLSIIMQRAQQFASAVVGQRGATISDAKVYAPLIADWQLSSSSSGNGNCS